MSEFEMTTETDQELPPIHVRLAVERVDSNLYVHNDNQAKFYTPGEEVSNQNDFLR